MTGRSSVVERNRRSTWAAAVDLDEAVLASVEKAALQALPQRLDSRWDSLDLGTVRVSTQKSGPETYRTAFYAENSGSRSIVKLAQAAWSTHATAEPGGILAPDSPGEFVWEPVGSTDIDSIRGKIREQAAKRGMGGSGCVSDLVAKGYDPAHAARICRDMGVRIREKAKGKPSASDQPGRPSEPTPEPIGGEELQALLAQFIDLQEKVDEMGRGLRNVRREHSVVKDRLLPIVEQAEGKMLTIKDRIIRWSASPQKTTRWMIIVERLLSAYLDPKKQAGLTKKINALKNDKAITTVINVPDLSVERLQPPKDDVQKPTEKASTVRDVLGGDDEIVARLKPLLSDIVQQLSDLEDGLDEIGPPTGDRAKRTGGWYDPRPQVATIRTRKGISNAQSPYRQPANQRSGQTDDVPNQGIRAGDSVSVVEIGTTGFPADNNTEEVEIPNGSAGTAKTVDESGLSVLVDFEDPAIGSCWVPISALKTGGVNRPAGKGPVSERAPRFRRTLPSFLSKQEGSMNGMPTMDGAMMPQDGAAGGMGMPDAMGVSSSGGNCTDLVTETVEDGTNHRHDVFVDSNGDGEAMEGENGGAPQHKHPVQGWMVQEAEDESGNLHGHELPIGCASETAAPIEAPTAEVAEPASTSEEPVSARAKAALAPDAEAWLKDRLAQMGAGEYDASSLIQEFAQTHAGASLSPDDFMGWLESTGMGTRGQGTKFVKKSRDHEAELFDDIVKSLQDGMPSHVRGEYSFHSADLFVDKHPQTGVPILNYNEALDTMDGKGQAIVFAKRFDRAEPESIATVFWETAGVMNEDRVDEVLDLRWAVNDAAALPV
jgi:hypothetical protein